MENLTDKQKIWIMAMALTRGTPKPNPLSTKQNSVQNISNNQNNLQ
jgi:hypothetical protein